jgi:hypothetical protein
MVKREKAAGWTAPTDRDAAVLVPLNPSEDKLVAAADLLGRHFRTGKSTRGHEDAGLLRARRDRAEQVLW